jgi:monofunctional biosynthetic peptidoglycan transglycosylase
LPVINQVTGMSNIFKRLANTLREKLAGYPKVLMVLNLFKKIAVFLFIAHLVYLVLLIWMPVYTTPYIISEWFERTGTDKKMYKDWVSADNISDNMKRAVIASEDQLFNEHFGFDIEAIEKAVKFNQRQSKRLKGASTISQQTAKNVFLWQGRNYLRKGLEVYFTFMIELLWGKERILEVYLNVAETGDGIFGVEAAAHIYFGKSAKNLTREEAALIAAVLPNPVKYKVKKPSPYVLKRQRWILRQMRYVETGK